jgi:hypothetical protein
VRRLSVTLLVLVGLGIVHTGLARLMCSRDALMELSRGHGSSTVALLVALLVVRMTLIFVLPSYVAFLATRWYLGRNVDS